MSNMPENFYGDFKSKSDNVKENDSNLIDRSASEIKEGEILELRSEVQRSINILADFGRDIRNIVERESYFYFNLTIKPAGNGSWNVNIKDIKIEGNKLAHDFSVSEDYKKALESAIETINYLIQVLITEYQQRILKIKNVLIVSLRRNRSKNYDRLMNHMESKLDLPGEKNLMFAKAIGFVSDAYEKLAQDVYTERFNEFVDLINKFPDRIFLSRHSGTLNQLGDEQDCLKFKVTNGFSGRLLYRKEDVLIKLDRRAGGQEESVNFVPSIDFNNRYEFNNALYFLKNCKEWELQIKRFLHV